MSHDKELEIQLQFLDEAQEYLGTLEAALLGLSHSGIDSGKVNAALRSAHSIKGGASMMGYHLLSDLAHRLEDSFKVLKIQKSAIEIDADLEGLLLTGVDCLRQVISGEKRKVPVDGHWLEAQATPIFDGLRDRLGEPQAEDANSMLSSEEGQDIIPLLFETEVEGCLQRLEGALQNGDPCLREEVEILAQELGGLGEMLQLTAFTQLCESIAHRMATLPDDVQVLATQALAAWRRSQSLVLAGQLDLLPTTIALPEVEAAVNLDALFELAAVEVTQIEPEWIEEPLEPLVEPEMVEPEMVEPEMVEPEMVEPEVVEFEPIADAEFVFTTAEILPPEAKVEVKPMRAEAEATEYRVLESPEPSLAEPQDNTVRVPMKQLNQLNDLFGELTIERNRLDLHVKRLRSMVRTLSHRVQILDQSNSQLRGNYDKTLLAGSMKLLPSKPGTSASNGSSNGSSNGFDALEMDRYDDLHLLSQEVMETIVQIQEVTSDVELGLEDAEQTNQDLKKTAKQLQTNLSQVRMRPLSDVVDRFPKSLRELSLQYGKLVELKVQGGGTLVDRNILEALNDPLMHLLRNAFDHGIESAETRRAAGKPEQGTIEIRAFHRNNRTFITLRDDGGGIPLEKVRSRAQQMGLDETLLAAASNEELLSLIFEPGFSTKDEVTSLSGRGVGMDVVRNNLKQVRGEITVDTQAGVGTTFTIAVPFTLSVARVLLVESNGMLLAFPTDVVEEMLVFQPDRIVATAGSEAMGNARSETIGWQDAMVQFVRLGQWLKFHCPRQMDGLETPPVIAVPTVLMVNQGSHVVGLQVDRCWGEQEVAIRKVEGTLPMPSGFNNCTILGDGRVVPLVNVPELLHWLASCDRHPAPTLKDSDLPTQPLFDTQLSLQPTFAPLPDRKPTILVVDDSINVRRLLALTLEKAGYEVAQAKDGQDALDKLSAGLHIQAVICDIEMPRLDGYGFLARVKANPAYEQLPIAMLTSRSGDKHRKLAMSLGATAYFSKPYNEQMLLQTLGRLMELTPAS